MKSEEKMAHFVVNTGYGDLPQEVVKAAKRDILDTVSTTLAGSRTTGVKDLIELLQDMGGHPESTIFVHGVRLPATEAALVNGLMAHALDFDDTHDTARLHAGVTVIPAAFAIAERIGGVSGKDFITAVTLGVDITSRMGLATKPWIGWMLTILYGYFGAATAAGKLLKLDPEGILNAWGIAYAQASGNGEGIASGALTKRLQAGFAAKGGILSALMAQKGITGAKESMEGGQGIFRLYQRGEYDPAPLTEGLGQKFEVANLSFKPYPCCRWTHDSIDVSLKLVREHSLSPEKIERVEIKLSKEAYDLNFIGPLEFKRKPRTVVDAQFSVPYAAATALATKKVDLNDFTEEAIKNPQVLRIADSMDLICGPPAGQGPSPAQVTVKTRQGETYSSRVEIRKGNPQNPMSDEELLEKFQNCAKWSVKPLKKEFITRVGEMITDLEKIKDVGEIPRLLTGK